MGLYLLFPLLFFLHQSLGRLDFTVGSRVSIPFPPAYIPDFHGRACFLDSGKPPPAFTVALSVEAAEGGTTKYACALAIFLADYKVWSSDHLQKFLPDDGCTLELASNGDLRLQDISGRIGWRTNTSGQGIKALWLQKKTGNLVLIDAENVTKWQSFDFPGDTLLQGQLLSAPARLTSFPSNSSEFYSFEFHPDNLNIFLNWRGHKYSYWELRPPRGRLFAFMKLGSTKLKLFERNLTMIGEIQAVRAEPVRFLTLESTGNLGLYHYSAKHGMFETSYELITRFCDLPLPCGPYGICTTHNSCTCVQQSTKECPAATNCKSQVEMVKLDRVDTVLRTAALPVTNVSTESCVSSCENHCLCEAAVYDESGKCFHYGLVAGVREIERPGLTYWVKMPKGKGRKHGAKNKLLIAGALLGLAVFVIPGVLYYCCKICKKRLNTRTDNN